MSSLPDKLESALAVGLPPAQSEAAAELARLLTDVASGTCTAAEAQQQLDGLPMLTGLLRALAGREIGDGTGLITFGSGNNFGDITIGDVAGRDLIKLTVTVVAPASQFTPQEQRNRRTMLQKVRTTWVEGLLDRVLAEAVALDLGLTERPDVIALPLNAQVQELERPPRDLPDGTTAIDAFDALGGTLLILGAPGAGKTILLLELCRDLLGRAERDEMHPIPVVFNLSSWGHTREPLAAWLVDELAAKYAVPAQTAQTWVAADALLPLLDGLDEVVQDQREACVAAINTYRSAHLGSIAICSRQADYDQLVTRLMLTGAVIIRPLTDQQIEGYLAGQGAPMPGSHTMVPQDSAIRELARTPLMLHVLSLTYLRQPLDLPEAAPNNEELWDIYIDLMLKRRGTLRLYRRDQVMHWLGTIAHHMSTSQQTLFFIEDLQPSWLPRKLQGWFAVLITLALMILLGAAIIPIDRRIGFLWISSVGIAALLGANLRSDPRPVWPWRRRLWLALIVGGGYGTYTLLDLVSQDLAFKPQHLPVALILTVLIGGASWLLVGQCERIAAALAPLMHLDLRSSLALRAGLIVGLAAAIVALGLWIVTRDKAILALAGTALGFGVGVGLLTHTAGPIIMVERLRWSWRRGLGVGLLSGLTLWVAVSPEAGLRTGVAFALLAGLVGSQVVEVRSTPNDGLRRSLWNSATAILVGTGLWLVFGFVAPYLGSVYTQKDVQKVAVIAALLWALRGGLAPALQHGLLRIMLATTNVLPLRLTSLVDDAVERIILRRVGGGYIYLHRLLLERLAQRAASKPRAHYFNDAT